MLAEVVVLVEVVVMVVVVVMLVLLEEEVVVMVVVDAATAAVVVDVVVELLLLLRLEGAVVILMLSFGNKVETGGDDWGRPADFFTVREDEMLFLFALTRGGIMDGRTEFDKFCVHVTLSNVSGVNCCTLETV